MASTNSRQEFVKRFSSGRPSAKVAGSPPGSRLKCKIDPSKIHPGVNLNIRDAHGNTPLMLALQQEHIEVAFVLAHAGADLTLVNSDGAGALLWACLVGASAPVLAGMMLRKGAPADPPAAEVEVPSLGIRQRLTPLLAATICGCKVTCQVLVKYGANIDRATFVQPAEQCKKGEPAPPLYERGGITSLMMACLMGHGELAAALVAMDASVLVEDADGRSALMHACINRHEDVRTALANCNIQYPMLTVVRNKKTKQRSSPWVRQCSSKMLMAVLVEEHHADGRRASMHACINCHEETALDLLAACHSRQRPALVAMADFKGDAPLHVACALRMERLVEALLAAGARPRAADSTGATPLSLAARVGAADAVAALLSGGAVADDAALTCAALARAPGGRDVRALLDEARDSFVCKSGAALAAKAAAERDGFVRYASAARSM
ncbi:ankyrin repeat-containing domain protein [Tribonema minus]|uniref:Ankyrin repeat-containing domain protein n=1 Tax=Tribonema minus TaxID=303371 RepID=A0A836CL65_9STRA|nr:ankyrin repeat-containing domain protein [Tribonema minus]